MAKKWTCRECGASHKTKKALVECLRYHIDESQWVIDMCEDELDELGVPIYD